MITERQERLLEFLKKNDNVYLSQYGIARSLPHLYFYEGTSDAFHDSNARKWLTADIRNINAEPSVEVLILSCNKGIKIATKEEFEKGMRAEFAAIFRRLKRAYAKARKGASNGQINFDESLNFNEYTVFKNITEKSKERG